MLRVCFFVFLAAAGMPRPGRDPNPSRLFAQPFGHGGSGGRQRVDVAARDGRDPALLPRVRGEPGLHEQSHVRRRSDGVRSESACFLFRSCVWVFFAFAVKGESTTTTNGF